jgi:hypothetical protein
MGRGMPTHTNLSAYSHKRVQISWSRKTAIAARVRPSPIRHCLTHLEIRVLKRLLRRYPLGRGEGEAPLEEVQCLGLGFGTDLRKVAFTSEWECSLRSVSRLNWI